jgi:hypothetical protein
VASTVISDWEVAFERWGSTRGKDGRPIGPPPDQPAEFLLSMVPVLTDDVGTTYRVHSKSAGGSGAEREGRWTWRPAPPPRAAELTLAVPGGKRLVVRREGDSGAWS